jgi:hypothetical protein
VSTFNYNQTFSQFVCLSVSLSVCLSVCPSMRLSVCRYLQSVCLFVIPSFCLSVCRSVCVYALILSSNVYNMPLTNWFFPTLRNYIYSVQIRYACVWL